MPFMATNNEPSPVPTGSRETTNAFLRMKLVGANPQAKVSGLEELPGRSNYFIGNDPKKWRTNVPNYAKVKYADVYPGVNLVYYGNQGKLEYDFVVQPGADPRKIVLDVGADLVPTPAGLRGPDAHGTAGETPARAHWGHRPWGAGTNAVPLPTATQFQPLRGCDTDRDNREQVRRGDPAWRDPTHQPPARGRCLTPRIDDSGRGV